MIAMTIISSISVYPRLAASRFSISLPLRIGSSIARTVHAPRVDIENILPTPTVRLGIVLRASLAPFRGPGHRIDGNAAQELDLGSSRVAHQRHALHQDVQILRVPVRPHLHLDLLLVGSVFIPVDGAADFA